jgi:ATP-dependent Lon protease
MVPLRDCALLPGVQQRLLVGRPGTLATLDAVGTGELLVVQQQSPHVLQPRFAGQLFKIGCVVRVDRREELDSGQAVWVHGVRRVRLVAMERQLLSYAGRVVDEPAALSEDGGEAAEALLRQRAHLLCLKHQPETSMQSVYALASGFAHPGQRQPILEATDLDGVLAEFLDLLDMASGCSWLQ